MENIGGKEEGHILFFLAIMPQMIQYRNHLHCIQYSK